MLKGPETVGAMLAARLPAYYKVSCLIQKAASACCQLGVGRTADKNEEFEASRSKPKHVQVDAGSFEFKLLHGGTL